MLTLTLKVDADAHEVGWIGCDELLAVNSYKLVCPYQVETGKFDCHEVDITGYPRWGEPAFALVTRMLAKVPKSPGRLLQTFSFDATLRFGRSAALGRTIETLACVVQGQRFKVTWRDEHSTREGAGPVRAHYSSVFELIEHAGRLALWGEDLEPEMPQPLTVVPIRSQDGQLVVRTSDIPAYTRRHFELRTGLDPADGPANVDARIWNAFIGQKQPA